MSNETTKGGITPQDTPAFAKEVAAHPMLRLRGLMAIVENTPDDTAKRAQFRLMRETFEQLRQDGHQVDTLSMGMSQDFRLAIEEGSTLVRIGSAIFGART